MRHDIVCFHIAAMPHKPQKGIMPAQIIRLIERRQEPNMMQCEELLLV